MLKCRLKGTERIGLAFIAGFCCFGALIGLLTNQLVAGGVFASFGVLLATLAWRGYFRASKGTVDSDGCHWRLEEAVRRDLAGSASDWPEPPAQIPEYFVVGHRSVPRVRFGNEEQGDNGQEFCSDCYAKSGQLHAVWAVIWKSAPFATDKPSVVAVKSSNLGELQMINPLLQDDALLADVEAAKSDRPSFRLWWLGQSGFLVQFNGRHALLDPYLSDSLTVKYPQTDKPHLRMKEPGTRRLA